MLKNSVSSKQNLEKSPQTVIRNNKIEQIYNQNSQKSLQQLNSSDQENELQNSNLQSVIHVKDYQNSNLKLKHFKNQLTQLNEKHRASIEIIKTHRRIAAASKSNSRSRSRSKHYETEVEKSFYEKENIYSNHSHSFFNKADKHLIISDLAQNHVINENHRHNNIQQSNQYMKDDQNPKIIQQNMPKINLLKIKDSEKNNDYTSNNKDSFINDKSMNSILFGQNQSTSRTNLTSVIKSHIYDDDSDNKRFNNIQSHERRLKHIIAIQNLNKSRLQQIQNGNCAFFPSENDKEIQYLKQIQSCYQINETSQSALQNISKQPQQEYMTFSKFNLLKNIKDKSQGDFNGNSIQEADNENELIQNLEMNDQNLDKLQYLKERQDVKRIQNETEKNFDSQASKKPSITTMSNINMFDHKELAYRSIGTEESSFQEQPLNIKCLSHQNAHFSRNQQDSLSQIIDNEKIIHIQNNQVNDNELLESQDEYYQPLRNINLKSKELSQETTYDDNQHQNLLNMQNLNSNKDGIRSKESSRKFDQKYFQKLNNYTNDNNENQEYKQDQINQHNDTHQKCRSNESYRSQLLTMDLKSQFGKEKQRQLSGERSVSSRRIDLQKNKQSPLSNQLHFINQSHYSVSNNSDIQKIFDKNTPSKLQQNQHYLYDNIQKDNLLTSIQKQNSNLHIPSHIFSDREDIKQGINNQNWNLQKLTLDDISERKLLEIEIQEKLKKEYDQKIQQFMHQFKTDQVQILKNEFTKEFSEVIEREKNIIQDQYQQLLNQERDLHNEEIQLLKKRLETERHEELENQRLQFEEMIYNERETIRIQCLQEYRNQKEDEFSLKLKQKLEKKVRAEIESQIKDEILKEMQNNHDIESQIRERLQAEYDKKLAQAKRKLKIELQEKETKLNENLEKNFDIEVRKKSIILLEKREIEIQRKYRMQFQKWQEKLKEEVEKKTVEIDEIKQKLNNDISELSRMKSQEQVRIKKQQHEQKQIIEEIQDCKNELEGQIKLQKIIAREKQIFDVKLENPSTFKIQLNNENKNYETYLNMPLQKRNKNVQQNKIKDSQSDSSFSKQRNINKLPILYNFQDPKSEYKKNNFKNEKVENQEYSNQSMDKPMISLEINNLKEDFGALQVIKQIQGSEDVAQKLAKIKQKYGSKNEENQSYRNEIIDKNQEQYMVTLGQREKCGQNNNCEQIGRGKQTWEYRRAQSQNNQESDQKQKKQEITDLIQDKYQQVNQKDELMNHKAAENMPLIYNYVKLQNDHFVSDALFINHNKKALQDQEKNYYEDIFEKNKNDFYEMNNLIFQNSQNEQQKNQMHEINQKYYNEQQFTLDQDKDDTLENLKGKYIDENEHIFQNNEDLNKLVKFGNLPLLTTQEKLILSESIKGLKYNDSQKQKLISDDKRFYRKSNVSQTSGSSSKNIKIAEQFSHRTDKQLKAYNDRFSKQQQNLIVQTDLNTFKEVLPPINFINCMEQYLKNDLIEFENIYKKKLIQIENGLQRVLENDHGLFDQLNKLWIKLNVSYKARYDYLQLLQNLIIQIDNNLRFQDDCASQNTDNLQQKTYQRLQDEVDRLQNYYENSKDIFDLIFKREDPKVDTKYKNILGSQIVIKIDDYRRKVKISKQSNINKQTVDSSYSKIQKNIKDSFVDDIFWRGVCYFDVCKAEKEIEEINYKERIKDEIQIKKNKYKQIQSNQNSFYNMPPKIPKYNEQSIKKLNPVCPLTSRSRRSSQSSFGNFNKNSQQNTSRK